MKVTAVFFNKQKNNINRYDILNNLDKITNSSNKVKLNKLNYNKYKKEKINNINLFNILNILKLINIKTCSIFILLLITIITLVSNFRISISSNILSLASNIYVNKKSDISISSVKNIYPVFNDTSYVYKEKDINKEKENNIDKDIEIVEKEEKEEKHFTKVEELLDNTDDILNKIENPNISQKQLSNRKEVKINNIVINNYSSHLNVDYNSLVNAKMYFTKASDKILFYHTHTSEAYTNSDKYKFEYSGTYRSRDEKFNMISVGKVLKEHLNKKNINLLHDTSEHDYYTYTTSYTRSRNTIKNNLNKDKYSLIVDLHRDAIADLTYAPTVSIEGKNAAQLMFVVGVGSKTYPNKNAKENLALAIKLQLLAESIYPGLFRPMMIKDSTYNQDMNKHSLLIECGATGNKLDEVYMSMELLSNLLEFMYVD